VIRQKWQRRSGLRANSHWDVLSVLAIPAFPCTAHFSALKACSFWTFDDGGEALSPSARQSSGLPKELVLYCGRHGFGTRVVRETGNLPAVMKTMGHKDVRTAMRYQHPELDIVREALNAPRTTLVQ